MDMNGMIIFAPVPHNNPHQITLISNNGWTRDEGHGGIIIAPYLVALYLAGWRTNAHTGNSTPAISWVASTAVIS